MPRLAGVVLVLTVLAASGWYIMSRTPPGNAEPPQNKSRDEFAADRAPAAAKPVAFDGDRAMKYLEAVCKIGPRMSGTEGMKKQQELLTKHFEGHGAKVELQKFTARQRSQNKPVEMANLIVTWHPDKQTRVILCAHYDTRPIADQEEDPRKWREPFLSANDGGSGVAFLMELAHHVKDLKTEVGVDFVFFDGEEYVFDPKPREEGGDRYFFGSEHFGKAYREGRPKHKYRSAVLLDMIAGKGARFPIEDNSMFQSAALVNEVWNVAAELKCDAFRAQRGGPVEDDHVALHRASGIPAIDVIDFSYPHWHKLSDVPENCSKEPMEQVARVLTVWVQRVK